MLGGTAELLDEKQSRPEHINGTVTTAGTPVSLTPSTGEPIELILVRNPSKGPNANSSNIVLLINIDGTSTYISLNRGETVYIPGLFSSAKIDSNTNGAKFEVIVWS
jgi:hypothetical protein